ncbi:MAG: DUF438 domain-containing protein [Candidatus Bathyarchaeota archaeon]|nr:DUF438 domain-containing protein [Candidatus Bathyarchaeota archaeon]
MNEEKKRMLKEMIKQLHAGASSEQVKEKFKKVLENTGSDEIAKIEQELVREGMPREELGKLCDVHLAVFREQLGKQSFQLPLWHPINILMKEHEALTQRSQRLGVISSLFKQACDYVHVNDALTGLQGIVKEFVDSEKHYLREENVLFPLLEKHGITEPPAIMWMEHDRIREQKKKLRNLVENWNSTGFYDFKAQLSEIAANLCEMLPSHFFKENNILFPAGLKTITKQEWVDARREFDEIGYCSVTPSDVIAAKPTTEDAGKSETASAAEGLLQFETGTLSAEEAEAILDTLPIDISFVDANDAVKYFNKAERRIFVRTKAVLGRKVQMCHPQKSVHIVNEILDAFRKGEKNTAEFWITMGGRLIHIRYFAVRNKEGKYLGTMEVTQDLTDIKKLEGEKRLLDWQK